MILALSILTALAVLWHERRHPGIASDLSTVGILSALAAIAAAVGEAVGSAAGAVGSAVGSAAGAVGSAAGEAAGSIGSALGIGGGAGGAVADVIPTVGATGTAGQSLAIPLGAGSSSPLGASTGVGVSGGAGSSNIVGNIQKLMSMSQGGGGGKDDKGGGAAAPPMAAPAQHVAALPPFQVPGMGQDPSLQNLVASIQARRQRLAAMGLGGMGGSFGGGGQ